MFGIKILHSKTILAFIVLANPEAFLFVLFKTLISGEKKSDTVIVKYVKKINE